MKKIIKENAEVQPSDDAKLKSAAKEYIKLNDELKKIEEELAPLLKKKENLNRQVTPLHKMIFLILKETKKDSVEVDNYILEILTVPAYKVVKPEYKDLWEQLLTKVNGAIRNVMENVKQLHIEDKAKKTKDVLSVSKINEFDLKSSAKSFIDKLKNLITVLKNYFGYIKSMKKLVKKSRPSASLSENKKTINVKLSDIALREISKKNRK